MWINYRPMLVCPLGKYTCCTNLPKSSLFLPFFSPTKIFYPNLPIFYTDISVKSHLTFCNSDCQQIDVWDSHLEAAFTAKPGDRESSRVAFSPRGEPSSGNLQSRSQLLCRWPCVPEIRPFLRPFNWNPPFYCSLWMALNWKIGKGSGLGWLAIVDSLTRGDGGTQGGCCCHRGDSWKVTEIEVERSFKWIHQTNTATPL